MKKKILALMLACVAMLSVVACGGNETETETNDNATVITEDAPMDAPVEKENWTDMVITVNALDAIGRPSAESFILKETTHDDMLWRVCDRYYDIPTTLDVHNGETSKATWLREDDIDATQANNSYSTVITTCFGNETSSHMNPMVSGIKVTLDPTIKKPSCSWYELALPAGITCGSTIAEVEAAYDAPTSTDVTAENCTVYRYDDADKHLVLEFDANNTVVVFEYYYDLGAEYTTVE